MLLLDLSHTAHTRSRTGVQRVTRALWRELGGEALPVCRDPYLRAWRPLRSWEIDNLKASSPAKKRGDCWPVSAKIRGWVERLASGGRGTAGALLDQAAQALIVPEIFSREVAASLPSLFAATAGPRVALFNDAIALTHPELTPAKTTARFPAYMRELLAFDGVAAISQQSRDALLGYWRWLGVRDIPPVAAIPLGVDAVRPASRTPTAPAGSAPVVLSVGTIEGRKNHGALLKACESLWEAGLVFELRLIGLAQFQTGGEAIAKIEAMRSAGRPVRYDGPVDERRLEEAYSSCAFTVYPSVAEGFGLPVIESLARGKACVCLGRGALGESAQGGGCMALDSVDAAALADAIARLLGEPALLDRLEMEARARKFKSWSDYARELTAWMGSLPYPG